MVGDEGKEVNGDEGSKEQIEGELVQPIRRSLLCKSEATSLKYVDPCEVPRMWRTTSYDLVSQEETATASVYKMDKTWLTADEVRVEIRWGHALWVIGRGDEPIKVELLRNSEMRVREATASMSPDGVLTVVILKRQRPWKWYELTDLVFLWFKMVHIGISS